MNKLGGVCLEYYFSFALQVIFTIGALHAFGTRDSLLWDDLIWLLPFIAFALILAVSAMRKKNNRQNKVVGITLVIFLIINPYTWIYFHHLAFAFFVRD